MSLLPLLYVIVPPLAGFVVAVVAKRLPGHELLALRRNTFRQ